MRIQVEVFGLPALTALCGEKGEIETTSNTFEGLVEALACKFGERVREILLDVYGRVDPEILVVVNNSDVLGPKSVGALRLAEGDHIKLIMMVGGG